MYLVRVNIIQSNNLGDRDEVFVMISFKLIPEDLSKSEETIDEISAHENGDE
jgi:hypothetical protein